MPFDWVTRKTTRCLLHLLVSTCIWPLHSHVSMGFWLQWNVDVLSHSWLNCTLLGSICFTICSDKLQWRQAHQSVGRTEVFQVIRDCAPTNVFPNTGLTMETILPNEQNAVNISELKTRGFPLYENEINYLWAQFPWWSNSKNLCFALINGFIWRSTVTWWRTSIIATIFHHPDTT